MLIGNNKPRLRNVEEAERRRLNLAPFEHKPETVNQYLAEELREEGSEILSWAIQGCLDWQKFGLTRPSVVEHATQQYFIEQDLFGQWLDDRCAQDKQLRATAAELYRDYCWYVKACGEKEPSQVWLAGKLEKRGFEKGKNGQGNIYYKGIGLKPDPDDDEL